jgi:hypothetical protein
MKFKDLKLGDNIYVLHSNNDFEQEIIKNVTSHNGYIIMGFETTDIIVRAKSESSIHFDEDADVVLFTDKHNLFKSKKRKHKHDDKKHKH